MAARTLTASNRGGGAPGPTTLPVPRLDLRYRLVVMASNAADLVTSAGGWLFDRAMAGCHVTAALAHRTDDTALQILGLDTVDLDDARQSRLCDHDSALAVSAELYREDARVRETVLDLLDAGVTNLVMWGDTWPPGFDGLGDPVHHRLSIAAHAFKAHALIAAAAPAYCVADLEFFRGIDIRTCSAAGLLLVAAS